MKIKTPSTAKKEIIVVSIFTKNGNVRSYSNPYSARLSTVLAVFNTCFYNKRQSVSNVKIAKILIFAFASVSESLLSIPVRLKSSCPAIFRHFQLGIFFCPELKDILDESKITIPGF